MRKLILSGVTLGLAAQLATAQIKLPSPSPGATVMQTVGTSEFTVKYSRPTLKGRTPFTDAFLPTGKIWRTGANQATAFTTSTDVMVNGKNLPAGTYAILSMPSMDDWTLIFSKNMTVTEPTYKEADDVLRVSLKPEMLPQSVEAFTINFGDLTDSTATLNFMFGKVNAKANLMVNTSQYAGANVDKAAAEKPDDPAVLQAAASYNLSKGRNLDQALEWINKSVATKETFRNSIREIADSGQNG